MKTRLTSAGQWSALRSFSLTALLVMTAGFVAAQSGGVELNPSHPKEYVVQRGDTLWDISGKFLRDPWYWPEIWYVNPQVENPHLIYPGDLLKLVYMDGAPKVKLEPGPARMTGPSGTERLSPRVRSEDLDQAITTIPFSVIEPFLNGGMIMDRKEIDGLPYVVALRDHLVAGAGHEVYVEDLDPEIPVGNNFTIIRKDDKLRDPDDGDLLGYEVLFIGNAELRAQSDRNTPATLFLTNTNREVIAGDLVKQIDLTLPMNFFPSAPDGEVEGTIISVVDGVALIGQYQMVILNRGSEHGLQAGSVLSVWQKGERVRDYSTIAAKVTLPDTFAGNVMVVKAYDDISYALVMEAVSEMRVGDGVRNP